MVCRATEVGDSTALSGIIRMVREASSTKAPIAKLADKVSGVFVPVVIGIAIITTLTWLIINGDAGFALARGISVNDELQYTDEVTLGSSIINRVPFNG
jgi:Cu2+-exporting ATPase